MASSVAWWRRPAVIAIALVLAGPALAQPDRDAPSAADYDYARGLSRVFESAVARVEESVVHITSVEERQLVARDFFGRPQNRTFRRSGLGSGVIVSDDGLILTNNHVVQGATQLIVRLHDGRELEANVVGTDELRDLAVLRVQASGLKAAAWGDSDRVRVGEWVLAVGSPFGFARTVTAGIVSAKGRGLGIGTDEFKEAEEYIQTDAAINPGNSGGPLINVDGEVIGINTAIFSTRMGGSIGLGFAIPSELARAVADNIVRGGRADFGWLGVEMGPLAEQNTARTGGGGVVVTRVVPGSPAERAGLRTGDVITRYRGRAVASEDQLVRAVQFTPPGSEVEMDVVRDGRPSRVRATIVDRTAALGGAWLDAVGFAAAPMRPDLRGAANTPSEGLLVLRVDRGGPAAQVGLEPGDVIVAVGGRTVKDVEELRRAVERARDRRLAIAIVRGGLRGEGVLRW
ncbi:MAG TPA: trypsin-like peptidase domain-containing protein [Phycisphaerales bacterium]|nr:trypsin-like peptidase domain-containing protein [Phycisphaerales bacterium]